MRCFWFITLIIGLMQFGCGAVTDDEATSSKAAIKATFGSDVGEPVSIGLADLRDELPQVDYAQFLEQGSVVERGLVTGTTDLSLPLRNALLSVASYRIDRIEDAVVRVQRFRINERFPILRFTGRRINAVLPFRLRVNGSIEFARLFESEAEAAAATRFQLLDYPHDVDSVLALPEGTVVTIPVQANVSFDVGGSFLHQSARIGGQVLQPLRASAIGSTSAVRQGTLIGTGSFRIQVMRLSGSRVRVRLLSAGGHEANARLTGNLWTSANYTFLPAAGLDRLRAFRRHLATGSGIIRTVRSVEDRIQGLRETLPDSVRGVLDGSPIPLGGVVDTFVEEALRKTDQALQTAKSLTTDLGVLDAEIGTRVENALSQVTSFWDKRITPVSNRIQRLSSRIYAFDQSVNLNDTLKRTLRLLADYEFDLSDDDAQIALDRAISGRSVWRGLQQSLGKWNTETTTFADFTLADALATEDRGVTMPRVKRLALGGADLRKRAYGVTLKGLGVRLGLDGSFERNFVTITNENGDRSEWHTRAWERGHRSQVFGNARGETYASGAFTNALNDELIDGGYWFRWSKTYAQGAREPVASALAHTLNDLGPLANEMGVAQLYFGEFPGKVSADFYVAINPHAMSALFDEDETPDEFLWEVLGIMMTRYERPLSLPYAHAPIRPNQLNDIDGAMAACERIAERLGGRYCYSFLDRIFPALRRAQREATPEARLDFFESFYRVPLGGSVLSTRVVVRYLAELFYAMDLETPLTVRFKITNDQDDSSAASPGFQVGDVERLSLGETTVLHGLSH